MRCKEREGNIMRKRDLKKRPKRRPEARWKNGVENSIRKVGAVNWRQV
jgi:hypothetical protein